MMMKIFTPFIIWFFFPFAVLNFLYRYKYVILSVCFVLALIVLPIYCNVVRTEADTVAEIDVTDYTFAFNTGAKRTVKTEYIVLHHIAGVAKISDIIKTHYKQNGWNGVGYHYFIDTDGKIYKLRDEDEKAPHTYGYNSNAIGICFNGNLSVTEPTKAQIESGLRLVRSLIKKYSIPVDNVKRHGELNSTECCGKLFNTEKFKEEI